MLRSIYKEHVANGVKFRKEGGGVLVHDLVGEAKNGEGGALRVALYHLADAQRVVYRHDLNVGHGGREAAHGDAV